MGELPDGSLREADRSRRTCFCKNLGSFEEEGEDGTGEGESFMKKTVQFPNQVCRPRFDSLRPRRRRCQSSSCVAIFVCL